MNTDTTTTDLYRYFNAEGELLYVGISFSAVARASQHRAEKGWWQDVARMTVEHLPNRAAAEQAERRAIANEKPLHNVVHNGKNAATVTLSDAFKVGEVYALGMPDGTCPAGLVSRCWTTKDDNTAIDLKLYSWMTGLFGHEVRTIILTSGIQAVQAISVMDAGDRVFDMDPLGSFQTSWTDPVPAQPKQTRPKNPPKGETGDAIYHAVLRLMSASETPSPWAYQDIVAAIGDAVRDATAQYLESSGLNQ